jgi:hypothetical protein
MFQKHLIINNINCSRVSLYKPISVCVCVRARARVCVCMCVCIYIYMEVYSVWFIVAYMSGLDQYRLSLLPPPRHTNARMGAAEPAEFYMSRKDKLTNYITQIK